MGMAVQLDLMQLGEWNSASVRMLTRWENGEREVERLRKNPVIPSAMSRCVSWRQAQPTQSSKLEQVRGSFPHRRSKPSIAGGRQGNRLSLGPIPVNRPSQHSDRLYYARATLMHVACLH